MLNILSPYGHTDSYFEIHLTPVGIASVKKTLGGEDVEKEQPLLAAGRRAIQFSHVKLIVEASPRAKNCMTQLPHSWPWTQRTLSARRHLHTHVPCCPGDSHKEGESCGRHTQ